MADTTLLIRIVTDASGAVNGSRDATRALAALDRQIEGVGSTLTRMEGALGRVGIYLKAHLALYAAEAGSRLLALAGQSLQAAAGLDELAEQLGVSARGLQALQLSAVQNGVKFEQLEAGIGKFSAKLGEAASGDKTMIEALDRIGVKILDTNGKLRPTETSLQNVAAAILAIEDPARRSAAMIDFFGKSGTRMLPMLKDLAGGLDSMADAAKRAGAMISADTIAKLDKLGDSAEKAKLQTRALFAENAAGPLTDTLDFIARKLENVGNVISAARNNLASLLLLAMNPTTIPSILLAPSPAEANAKALAEAQSRLGYMQDNLASAKTPRDRARMQAAVDAANTDLAKARARQEQLESATGRNIGVQDNPPDLRAYGGSNPPPTGGKGGGGGGQSDADKYAKLIAQLDAAAKAQDKMTIATERGGAAFREQEIHAEALAKAVDIFGSAISDADPKVAEIEKRLRQIADGKAAQAFTAGTNALREENVLLEAQNRLMNEAPEIQAREIALIKAKQEAEKGGAAITADMTEQRRKAIEQNETLKLQAEQMKAANELWTEPLKQGLRNIQTAGADAWETILQTGEISFRSLGEVFTKTLRRMAAEFLALATIRPVMTMLVEAIGPGGIGLIGGNTAAQLGGGSAGGGAGGGSGGGLGSILGGGGLGSIFSGGGASGGGWLARQFSGISNWLASPIGGFGGALNSSSPAASAAMNGSTGLSMPGLGGLTWGSAIGGLGSIGMGAYGLLKGGGGIANTIGSIGQIAGGVMMMIPGLQPFGAALSLLSSFVPGLFGDGPKTPPQPALAYGAGQFRPTSMGGYSYTGDSLGAGSPMNDAARQVAANLRKSFRAAGLSTVPGSLIGGNLASGMDHQLNGQQWSDRPYTETGLILPGGAYEPLTGNDASRNPQQASEYLVAQAFRANVLRGGVSGAGAGLKQGLERINPLTAEDLDNVIAMGRAYDELGKATNTAKDGVDKLNAAFDDLKDYADRAGLAMEPINAELAKQTKRAAQDFVDQMLDPLAVQMRALEDERKSAIVSAEYIRDNIKDVYVDMDRIATYYTNKEAALRDQFYRGGVANLQALIDKLTYGDLANASPTLQLSGTKAAYNAALAQARAGDAGAITNLSSYAENYLGVARQSFASSPEYQALVEQIRSALQELSITLTGGTTAATGTTTATQQSAQGQQIAQLIAMLQESEAARAEERRANAEMRDLLQRYVTNRAA